MSNIHVDYRLSRCIHELKRLKKEIGELKKSVNKKLNSIDSGPIPNRIRFSMYGYGKHNPNTVFRMNIKRSNKKTYEITKKDMEQCVDLSGKNFFHFSYYQLKTLFGKNYTRKYLDLDKLQKMYGFEIIPKKNNRPLKIESVEGTHTTKPIPSVTTATFVEPKNQK